MSQYNKILESAFKNQFEHWETLSPLDPLKIFYDAILGSLEAIEDKQKKMTHTLLDSLPTLFGFNPKTSKLAIGSFLIKLSPHNTKSVLDLDKIEVKSQEETYLLFPLTLEKEYTQCQIANFKETVSLGYLKGEAWEEIFLSRSLHSIPEELTLTYPSGDKTILRLVKKEALLALTNETDYQNSFFYNGVRNSIVIPASDKLMLDFNGGVEISAHNILYCTEPTKELLTQLQCQDYHEVESVSFQKVIAPSQGAENTAEFLARFYRHMHKVSTLKYTEENLLLSNLKDDLLLSIENLKQVDIKKQNKHLEVFYVFSTQENKNLRDLEMRLKNLLPLTYTFELKPFTQVAYENLQGMYKNERGLLTPSMHLNTGEMVL
jgi:hypothetical protein